MKQINVPTKCIKKEILTTIRYTVISLSVFSEDPDKDIVIQKEVETWKKLKTFLKLGNCLLVEINNKLVENMAFFFCVQIVRYKAHL